MVETALDGAKLAETISFSQLVKGGSLITKTRDAHHRRWRRRATPSGAASRGKIPARSRTTPRARTSHPTEVPIHHDIEERGPHHIVATPAPIRDHPMLRAHRDAVSARRHHSRSGRCWLRVGGVLAGARVEAEAGEREARFARRKVGDILPVVRRARYVVHATPSTPSPYAATARHRRLFASAARRWYGAFSASDMEPHFAATARMRST